MVFTDSSYYKGDIDIPFENKSTTAFTRDYITPFEEDVLVKCLGRKLYTDFIAGLVPEGQQWLDLRDGATYNVEYDGVEHPVKWNGLVNAEKKSLLSYYVYFNWLNSNYTQLLGTGVAVADKKNANTVDVREKYLLAESKCINLIGTYPISPYNDQGVVFPSEIDESCIKVFEPTLFNFLYYNKDDYPGWVFTPLKKSNYFDI